MAFSTIPPGDFHAFELLNDMVQQREPATALDPELMGPLAAIGIIKGTPFPSTGYRTLDARSAFFYGVTGITPAMAMRVPGIGSQDLFACATRTRTMSTAPKPTR